MGSFTNFLAFQKSKLKLRMSSCSSNKLTRHSANFFWLQPPLQNFDQQTAVLKCSGGVVASTIRLARLSSCHTEWSREGDGVSATAQQRWLPRPVNGKQAPSAHNAKTLINNIATSASKPVQSGCCRNDRFFALHTVLLLAAQAARQGSA